jgi:hypothetical protein
MGQPTRLQTAISAIDSLGIDHGSVMDITFSVGHVARICITFYEFHRCFRGRDDIVGEDSGEWEHLQVEDHGVTFAACRRVERARTMTKRTLE